MKEETIKYLQNVLGVEADGDIGPITRKALHTKLLQIACKELGVSEIGKSNTGKRVKEYQATTNLGGTGWPWCAAYICWIFKQAGIFTEDDRPKTAAAYGFETWAKKLGISVIKKPDKVLKGDIVIYSFSHIGIASSDSGTNGTFTAYEGNTNAAGSREGGSVLEKYRNLSSVRSVVRF